MPNDDLARFFRGVILVRENPRQWIAEYRDRLGEAYVVIPVVGPGFARIPFEHQRHRISLQNTEISRAFGRAVQVAGPVCPSVTQPGPMEDRTHTCAGEPANLASSLLYQLACTAKVLVVHGFHGRGRADWAHPCDPTASHRGGRKPCYN